jgi:hypothetical protein
MRRIALRSPIISIPLYQPPPDPTKTRNQLNSPECGRAGVASGRRQPYVPNGLSSAGHAANTKRNEPGEPGFTVIMRADQPPRRRNETVAVPFRCCHTVWRTRGSQRLLPEERQPTVQKLRAQSPAIFLLCSYSVSTSEKMSITFFNYEIFTRCRFAAIAIMRSTSIPKPTNWRARQSTPKRDPVFDSLKVVMLRTADSERRSAEQFGRRFR